MRSDGATIPGGDPDASFGPLPGIRALDLSHVGRWAARHDSDSRDCDIGAVAPTRTTGEWLQCPARARILPPVLLHCRTCWTRSRSRPTRCAGSYRVIPQMVRFPRTAATLCRRALLTGEHPRDLLEVAASSTW
jgi:hypothetical protein